MLMRQHKDTGDENRGQRCQKKGFSDCMGDRTDKRVGVAWWCLMMRLEAVRIDQTCGTHIPAYMCLRIHSLMHLMHGSSKQVLNIRQ